jgi:lipid-binding SYLF domain-containing protein
VFVLPKSDEVPVPQILSTLKNLASKFFSLAEKEASVLQTLNAEVQAVLKRLAAEDPGLKELLEKAHAYAVFPSVGKAAAVIGGAFGKGEVFERGSLVGYAGLAQLTLGVQVGGDTFSEIIAFENKQALGRFKQGRWAFAANASAVLVKAGAAASASYEKGAAVFVYSEGGMLLEAAIGTQKFFFRPAVLGRGKKAPAPKRATATAARGAAKKGGSRKAGTAKAGRGSSRRGGSRRRSSSGTKAKRPAARARTAGKR